MSEAKKYRKKAVEIEALRYDGENHSEIQAWAGGANTHWLFDTEELEIRTLEGNMRVRGGDYVIKGVEGEFYPCKPAIFDKTYEAV